MKSRGLYLGLGTYPEGDSRFSLYPIKWIKENILSHKLKKCINFCHFPVILERVSLLPHDSTMSVHSFKFT